MHLSVYFCFSESYRCGIFYAGKKGAKPIRALHVLPKRFTFDCSRDYEIMSQEVKKECGSIVSSLYSHWRKTTHVFAVHVDGQRCDLREQK